MFCPRACDGSAEMFSNVARAGGGTSCGGGGETTEDDEHIEVISSDGRHIQEDNSLADIVGGRVPSKQTVVGSRKGKSFARIEVYILRGKGDDKGEVRVRVVGRRCWMRKGG